MRVRTKSIAAPALLLPALLLAQKAPAQDLVGTWIRTVDGQAWVNNGFGDSLKNKTRQEYLILRADGTYSLQVMTKAPRLLGDFGSFMLGGQTDSVTGQLDSVAGTSPLTWGRWALAGDSIKFGRDGQYGKHKAALGSQELSLTQAQPIQASAGAKGVAWDPGHHTECTVVFRRYDPAKPLPGPDARNGCQTVAGAFPWPPMPKVAELLGTWAWVQHSTWYTNTLCKDNNPCPLVTYDTVTFRADSTMLHSNVVVSPAHPEGQRDAFGGFAPQLRWWIASDTLWREGRQRWPMTSAAVWLEDGGRYLHFDNTTYHRVTTPAP